LRASQADHVSRARHAGGAATGDAPAAAVWEQVARIGGDSGYYYLDWLWRARELLDVVAGGGGLVRGRARPRDVRVGDRIDTWEVIGVEPGRRLTLRFGMKAPGAGELEFEVQPLAPARTRLAARSVWRPDGVAGVAYWWAFAPAHFVLYDGLAREILRRAIQAGGGAGRPA
jgi:hypothetical protein